MATTSAAPDVSAFQLPMGKPTRDAFGEELASLARTNNRIVGVDGDVNNSTRMEWFAREFPHRFFNVGIAESNLVGVAAGLAGCGKIPFAASFACFVLCNAYDQLRMSVAFPRANVKVVGSHAGISIGEDGPSQMGIEDIALASSLPGFVVLVPADETGTRLAVRAAADHEGPVYIRVGRPKVPLIYPSEEDCPFAIGQAITLRTDPQGDDVTIAACGLMVSAALEAHAMLAARGVRTRVLDLASVKPVDEQSLARAAGETGGIVVAEEHLAHGGLGSAVAMSVARRQPVPLRFVNLGDTFAESGAAEALMGKFGLTAQRIVAAVDDLLGHRRR